MYIHFYYKQITTAPKEFPKYLRSIWFMTVGSNIVSISAKSLHNE